MTPSSMAGQAVGSTGSRNSLSQVFAASSARSARRTQHISNLCLIPGSASLRRKGRKPTGPGGEPDTQTAGSLVPCADWSIIATASIALPPGSYSLSSVSSPGYCTSIHSDKGQRFSSARGSHLHLMWIDPCRRSIAATGVGIASGAGLRPPRQGRLNAAVVHEKPTASASP